MDSDNNTQTDIGGTLCRLLPVEGQPKTLSDLMFQVRLLNDIRHPNEESFRRIVLTYLQSPEFTNDVRFHRVDPDLHPEQPQGRWTRVRRGPAVSSAISGRRGPKPDRTQIKDKLDDIWNACTRSSERSYLIWDILDGHFGINKDNNSYYRQWLRDLSNALGLDARFVMIAVDERTNIPVEWMLTANRLDDVQAEVGSRLQEILDQIKNSKLAACFTRDLVRMFFQADARNEIYDVHRYYRELSAALGNNENVLRLDAYGSSSYAEAWISKDKAVTAIRMYLDKIYKADKFERKLTDDFIGQQCLEPKLKMKSTDRLDRLVAEVVSQDPRFIRTDSTNRWEILPTGPVKNASAYRILLDTHLPQYKSSLIEFATERFPAFNIDFELDDDDRFRSWDGSLWALVEWVDINDQAYELLEESGKPLTERTIVNTVCTRYMISSDTAIFNPVHDSRFTQTLDGKWRLSYELTEDDIKLMLEFLMDSGKGNSLDDLVFWTIGLDASGTNALECLNTDSRFVLIDDLWFLRMDAKTLGEDDLEALLDELRRVKTGLRLSTLIQRVLGQDDRPLDIEKQLHTDERFLEIIPGVWTTSDFYMIEVNRQSLKSNLAFRSTIPEFLSDLEVDDQDADYTLRLPAGSNQQRIITEYSHTFSPTDIASGSIGLTRNLKALLQSITGEYCQIVDDVNSEFTCWIDLKSNLLSGFSTWLESREVTYGDELVLRLTDETHVLSIELTGKHDQNAYQKALKAKDSAMIIDSANMSGKSYHDLIIEVLQHSNDQSGNQNPVHRDRIFEMVNSMRLANRDTIFSILSLPNCPYQELRYFVSHGNGYWSYDVSIHKLYVDRMSELKDSSQIHTETNPDVNQSPEVNNSTSADDTDTQDTTIDQTLVRYQDRIVELEQENQQLKNQTAELEEEVSKLHSELDEETTYKKTLLTVITQIQTRVEHIEDRYKVDENDRNKITETLETHNQDLCKRLDSVQTKVNDTESELQKSAQDFAHALLSLEYLLQANTQLESRLDRNQESHIELDKNVSQLQQALFRLENNAITAQEERKHMSIKLNQQLSYLYTELDASKKQQDELEDLRVRFTESTNQVNELEGKLDPTRNFLQTATGRILARLFRLLGGPDLRDL